VRHVTRAVILIFVLTFSAAVANAQVITGTPPYASFGGGPETINLANLNAHFNIPVLSKAGRGIPFNFYLTYDTAIWYPATSGSTKAWTPVSNYGWAASPIWVGYIAATVTTTELPVMCGKEQGDDITYFYNWTYYDGFGTGHSFPNASTVTLLACTETYEYGSGGGTATDGSGYVLAITGTTLGSLFATNGSQINPFGYNPSEPTLGAVEDRNGNEITTDGSGHLYDTLNATTATITVTGSGATTSPKVFTYTPPNTSSSQCATTNTAGVTCYVVYYENYTLATNFGVSGISEYKSTAAVPLVTTVSLPDGSFYHLTYETTPGSCTPYSGTTCTTGRVISISLPTQGTITYSYSGGSNGILADGSTATLTRTTPDGTWTYAQVKGSGAASTTTVTDPQSNVTTINFQGIYEAKRVVNQGASTVLLTRNTCYNGASIPCTGTAITLPISSISVSSVLPGSNNLEDLHSYTLDAYGDLTQQVDYDYGSGAVGSLLDTKTVSYASLGNIKSFQQTVTITNGSGSTVSETKYTYDGSTLQTSSGTPQHVSVTGSRGNLTSVTLYTSASTYLTKSTTYYDTGMPYTATDVNGGVTTYDYPNSTSTCGNAFPTEIQEPISTLTRQYTWTCSGAVMVSSIDENNQYTTTTYNDPYFWRPASTSYADGGLISWTYNSETSVTTTTKMNSSQNITSLLLLDSLGRTLHHELTSDPEGYLYVDTTYDSLGRIYSVSNPYRTSSDMTYGLTKYQYDALSRPTYVTPQDGSANVSVTYTNNCSTVTDQAAKKRETCSNSLGYLTQVFEDPSGLDYETDYTVDPLGNTLTVNQKGGNSNSSYWRTRTYYYDFLSRLTQSIDPEAGTVNYYYDANGYPGDLTSRVAPLPNQTGSSTVTTTYTHDALHRLKQRSYSDGITPTDYFAYDGPTNGFGINATNLLGRISEAWANNASNTTVAAEIFGYDPLGRTNLNTQLVSPSSSYYSVAYSYDLAGDMLTATNGQSVTISYGYDTAARPTSITSSLVDSQHPATLATINWYSPLGSPELLTYGNNLGELRALNNTGELCRINVNTGVTAPPTIQHCSDSLGYTTIQDYYLTYNEGSTNNGNTAYWQGTYGQTFNRTYGYDSLNRLSTMSDSNTSQACKGLSWTYDPWGNLTNQTVTSGSCLSFSNTPGTNNRLSSPYTYDAAGNMTYDGTHHYYYDAENRLIQTDGTFGTCSTATVCYVYTALGRRAEKTLTGGWYAYIHDLNGKPVSISFSGSWGVGNVYLGGQLIAEYENGTTYFIHRDPLGSQRLASEVNQSLEESFDYYPYGALTSTDTGNFQMEFTGLELDGETALNHADFRQLATVQGRWITPDPAGLTAVDPTNPQSLNRYGYVLNNPLKFADPSGMHLPCRGIECVSGSDGGDTCMLDGAYTSCDSTSINGLFAGGGPAAPCPNNNCWSYNVNYGEYTYFAESVNGDGAYFPVEGPGWQFSTLQGALAGGAIWAAAVTADTSNTESCGLTYATGDGTYSFTGALEGQSATCSNSVMLDALKLVPDGIEPDGAYHAHNTIPGYNPERFSGQLGDPSAGDVGWSDQWGNPLSLGTPGGRIIIYYPPSCQVFVQGSPVGSGTTIPLCQ
jgi:RHS repeat-associated protein